MTSSKHALAALLALMTLPAGPAAAATIVIDQFVAPQLVVARPARGSVAASEVAAPLSIGGYREMRATNRENRLNGTTLEAGEGVLDFSNAARTSGTGTLTWNGIRSTGLRGLDVTDGGTNDAVFFDVLFSDANVDMTFSLRDTAGRTSTYSYLIGEELSGSAGAAPVVFSFADFAGTADLRSINSVSFTLAGRAAAVDASLDLLYFGSTLAPVPLPAGALLLGSALLGAGLMGRRRAADRVA